LKNDPYDVYDGTKMKDGRRIINTLIYWNDINQLNHSMQVTNIEDYLGRIGGIFGILLGFF